MSTNTVLLWQAKKVKLVFKFRELAFCCLAGFFLFGIGQVKGQEFPSKPLKIVVPNTPGTGPDIIPRIIAPKMSEILGQPVVVENRPGANQLVGFEYVATLAPPDGYTLVSTSVTDLLLLSIFNKDLRFDPLKDLPPVIGLVEGRLLLSTSPRFPWKSFNDFVVAAKARPGKLNFGASSASIHLYTESLIQEAGLNIVHIPYSSGAPFIQGVMAGDVELGMIGGASGIALGDKLRNLAVTGTQRHPSLPDVPTFAELGYPKIRGLTFALNVRAGTPKAIVDRLYATASKALQRADVRLMYSKVHLEISELSPDAASKRWAEDGKQLADIAKKAGIQAQ